MKQLREPSSILAWLGLGIGLIGIAFTLRPPTHISPLLFWLILLLGILAVAVGARSILGGRSNRTTRIQPISHPGKRRLLAIECDRFSDTLSDFLGEQLRLKPRPWRFGNGAGRLRLWHEQVEARYRQEFRPWGLELFDAAVRLDGVDASSRVFVDAPSPTQLGQLPELFRDAARSLKRSR